VAVLVYLSPLLIGLFIPFLLKNSERNQPTQLRKIIALLIPVILPAALLAFIFAVWQACSPGVFSLSASNLLKLTIFLCGWSVMIIGVHRLLITLLANRNLAYIILMLLIILMNTTVFYVNPFLDAVNSDLNTRKIIIKLAISLNPILAIAGSFFRHDLLRANIMYSLCDIGPYYFYTYTSGTVIFISYMLIGLLTLAASFILKFLIKRNDKVS
jgi:hypothetical protein